VFTTSSIGAAPVISMVSVSDVTGQNARISWSTDKPSNTVVEFWPVSGSIRKATLGLFVTQHSIALSNLNKETFYQFRVKSTDPDGNLAVSPDSSFTTTSSGSGIVALPRFFDAQEQTALGEEVFANMAFTNLGSEAATLTLTAIDSSGNPITGQGIVNPAEFQLNPKTQSAKLDLVLFGEGLGYSGVKGWIKVESTTSNVGGISVAFDSNLSFMDSSTLGGATLTDFAFTEIEANGSTRINTVNQNSSDVTAVFDLMKSDGSVYSSQSRTIKANGALVADLFNDLFAGIAPAAGDYVRVNTTKGVLASEMLQKNGGDYGILNGQDGTAGGLLLYAPHHVLGNQWETTLSVVNLDSKAGKVQFQFIGENGVQVVSVRTLDIPPNGKLFVSDARFFGQQQADKTYTGYVKVLSDGVRLTGSTTFGSRGGAFSSALPLIDSLQNTVLYGHAVSNDLYQSGIAILNPNNATANAVIEIYGSDGTLLERKSESIPAGLRSAKLLTEYFPSLAGKDQTSGYIRIASDQPLASYSLFGTSNLSVLSAIPAQPIQ